MSASVRVQFHFLFKSLRFPVRARVTEGERENGRTGGVILAAVVACGAIFLHPGYADEPGAVKNGLPLLLHEDFENGRDNWETTDDAAWKLTRENGNTVFSLVKRHSDYTPPFRSPHNIALLKKITVADFDLTVRVKSTKDTGNHRDCCIFFCYQDPAHFYYVHCGQRPDPHSGQIMIVNGAARRALTENKKTIQWDDQWHTVRVVRKSDTGLISVWFDDMKQPLMTAQDKTFGKGRIGIGSFDDMNDFDDVLLYGK